MDFILKYNGNGSLISVPARDLTEEDLKNISWTGWTKDELVKSGLYTEIKKEVIKKKEVKHD